MLTRKYFLEKGYKVKDYNPEGNSVEHVGVDIIAQNINPNEDPPEESNSDADSSEVPDPGENISEEEKEDNNQPARCTLRVCVRRGF
jgi:hypothetical protein